MKFIKIQDTYINLSQVTDIQVDQDSRRIIVGLNDNINITFDFDDEQDFFADMRILTNNMSQFT